jgi:ribose transport system substrate-binding protein
MLYRATVLLMLVLCSTVAQAQRDVIAFVQDNMGNDFRRAQVMEAKDEAQKRGLSFVHTDAQGQTSRLISQMNEMIERQVGVIILGTNDEKAVVPIVSKAEKSGVRVVVLDRGIASKDYTTFINSDNMKIGEMGASYIGKKLGGKGTVLLFEGLQTADVTLLRTRGFLKGMQAYPDIKVVRRTANYLRRDAIQETEKLLEAGTRFDAVFSESDSMLSGVRMVLEKRKINPGSIVTVGVDYISEARDAIRQRTQSASILFPLGGRQAIAVAQDLLNGRKVPRHISVPVQWVNLENVEQVSPIF